MATQAQDDRTATRELPSGWYAFAGALLVIVGSLNLLQGLIALLKDDYFAGDEGRAALRPTSPRGARSSSSWASSSSSSGSGSSR